MSAVACDLLPESALSLNHEQSKLQAYSVLSELTVLLLARSQRKRETVSLKIRPGCCTSDTDTVSLQTNLSPATS